MRDSATEKGIREMLNTICLSPEQRGQSDYTTFLEKKSQMENTGGFEPTFMPSFLFDFQAALSDWGIRKGRAALFEDCVAGDSHILTSLGYKRVDTLARIGHPIEIISWSQNGFVRTLASAPYLKGKARMYEIACRSGRTLTVAAAHRFMTSQGWTCADSLQLGQLLAVYDGDHQRSTLASFPLVRAEDGLHFSEITPDSLGYCSAYRRPYGEQPLTDQDSGGVLLPLLSDALGRIPLSCGKDDRENGLKYSHLRQHTDLLSRSDSERLEHGAGLGGEFLTPSSSYIQGQHNNQNEQQFYAHSILLSSSPELLTLEEKQFVVGPYGTSFDTVSSIREITEENYYDLWVPATANYVCNGFVSHNCGLGKTIQQLVWAQNIIEHTNKPVLILTPLAVSFQTVAEAEKFGMEAVRSHGHVRPGARIVVTNYEKLHLFDRLHFGGVIADESSRIKAFDAKTCASVIDFLRPIPYRLLCTATAAPNDYPEFGTSAEALGVARRVDMLHRYFTHDSADTAKWRLKKHAARAAFWQWMGSWARAIRSPSDLGFPDERFQLPLLVEQYHVIRAAPQNQNLLFPIDAIGLSEQRAERRTTLTERCEKVAELINPTGKPAIAWCHLNAEGDLLAKLIPDAIQVSGKDSDDAKEEKLLSFVQKQSRVLIIKPKIGAHGLNMQHCAHMTTFSSNSFEEDYQQVRRCYRFGQTSSVRVDRVISEGERRMMRNLQRKAKQAEVMYTALIQAMRETVYVPHMLPRSKQLVMPPAWL